MIFSLSNTWRGAEGTPWFLNSRHGLLWRRAEISRGHAREVVQHLPQGHGDGDRLGYSLDTPRRYEDGTKACSLCAGDIPAWIVADEYGLSGTHAPGDSGRVQMARDEVCDSPRRCRKQQRRQQRVGYGVRALRAKRPPDFPTVYWTQLPCESRVRGAKLGG